MQAAAAIEATPATLDTNTTAELSPEQEAVAFLEAKNAAEKPESKEPAKPAEPKPEEPAKPEPAKELAELSERQRALNGQIQAAKRIEERTKAEQAKLASEREAFESRVAEFDRITKSELPLIVEHIAKNRGVDLSVVWNEFVEMAKNGGKLPDTLATRREIEGLKAEKSREAKEREAAEAAKREQESKAAETQQWAEVVDESLGDPKAAQVWPRLMAMSENERIELLLVNANAQFEQTGKLPNQIRFLNWVESQLPEAVTPETAPATQAKTAAKTGVVVPSGKDASAPPKSRDDMSEDELIDDAARWLSSQG